MEKYSNLKSAISTEDSNKEGRLKDGVGKKKRTFIQKVVKNFKEGLDFKGYRKDKKAAKDSLDEAAQMEHVLKYSHHIIPSYLKDQVESGKLDKEYQDYIETKRKIKNQIS